MPLYKCDKCKKLVWLSYWEKFKCPKCKSESLTKLGAWIQKWDAGPQEIRRV